MNANSKLVEVLTVAHVDAEDHVGNSLFSILPLMFCRGYEIKSGRDSEARFGRFGQDFEF